MSKKIKICTRKTKDDIKCFDNEEFSGDFPSFFETKGEESTEEVFVCSRRYCNRFKGRKNCCKKIKTQRKTADSKVSGGKKRKYIKKNKTKKRKSYKKKYSH